MITFDARQQSAQDNYKLLIGSVVPRPIAFVSTISASGVRNLSPFSFFTVASSNPPVVCFVPMVPAAVRQGGETLKDTLRNVRDTGEFVLNIVSEDFAAAMNLASGEYPPEVDEFALSGLTPIASETVKPDRVAEARIQMECRVLQIVEVSALPMGGSLVLGSVLRFHVADEVMREGRIDPDALQAIGRMGGNTYSRTLDRFDLARPVIPR